MRRFRILIPVATLAIGALALTGCISLLPKTEPVQMYRFVFDPALVETPPPEQRGVPVGLAFSGAIFPPGSAGDGILTVEDNEVAYVASARWAAGAQPLFNEAVQAGYARSGGSVRLESRGRSAAPYRLDVSVRQFETRYVRHKPVVTVAMDARILRQSDRSLIATRFISRDIPVRRNDMSMTVEGYNTAVSQAVGELISFSQETLSPLAPPLTPGTLPGNGKAGVEGL